MDEHEVLRQAIGATRAAEAQRRQEINDLVASTRGAMLSDGQEVDALRFYECLIVEQALLEALARNTEAMASALDSYAS